MMNKISKLLRHTGQECFDDYKLIARRVDDRVWEGVSGDWTATAFRIELTLQLMTDFGEDWT